MLEQWWWGSIFVMSALLAVLRLFQGVVANWGIAIVLLTVLVKVLTIPLTRFTDHVLARSIARQNAQGNA